MAGRGIGPPVCGVRIRSPPPARPSSRRPALRREIAKPDIPDVTPFIGKITTIDGERHRVLDADPEQPGKAIVAAGDRHFSTGIETLRLLFD